MATPRSRTRLRRFSYGLLWIMVIGWTLFTGWRWFGPDVTWPVVVALAYTPYIAAATVIPILLAIWLRAVRLLTLVVLCACALVVVLLPRAFGDGTAGADGSRLRVMSVNVLAGADLETVVSLVMEHKIDVLSIQQLTKGAVEALDGSELRDRLPYDLLEPGTMGEGTGIYSRYDLSEDDELATDGLFYNPAATLDVPDIGEVEFLAVHPSPPLNPDRTKVWKRDLSALPAVDPEGPPRIVAGDFNATLDHKTMRDLIDTGYTDAADATGNGLTGTWPTDKPLPKVTIDHILTSPGISTDNYAVHHVPGTDHRAITATVTLPKPDD